MISSAIWNKKARVNFSKTNKIARARRVSAQFRVLRNLQVIIYSKLHEKNHVITIVNNIRTKFSHKQLKVCFYFALKWYYDQKSHLTFCFIFRKYVL